MLRLRRHSWPRDFDPDHFHSGLLAESFAGLRLAERPHFLRRAAIRFAPVVRHLEAVAHHFVPGAVWSNFQLSHLQRHLERRFSELRWLVMRRTNWTRILS
jgi:hypothetical protein